MRYQQLDELNGVLVIHYLSTVKLHLTIMAFNTEVEIVTVQYFSKVRAVVGLAAKIALKPKMYKMETWEYVIGT